MITKQTLKTKTFWGGLATVATGVGLILSDNVVEGVQTIAIGILAIFGRDALAKR